jgi:formate dehydrogenase subunit delta
MSLACPTELRLISKIAIHFRHLPTDVAAASVAEHVTRFWNPRMKVRLIEEVADDPTGLDPIVIAAIEQLR